jgi:hypothetical protein
MILQAESFQQDHLQYSATWLVIPGFATNNADKGFIENDKVSSTSGCLLDLGIVLCLPQHGTLGYSIAMLYVTSFTGYPSSDIEIYPPDLFLT